MNKYKIWLYIGASILVLVYLAGTGTEPKRTGSGIGTFKILKTGTRTETIISINKVPEPNRNF